MSYLNRIIVILCLISKLAIGQDKIFFRTPIEVVTIEKLNGGVKKDEELKLIGLSKVEGIGIIIHAKNAIGEHINIDNKEIKKLSFKHLKIDKMWSFACISNNTYQNILQKGYQYDVRDNLKEESIEYLQRLEKNGYFLKDDYLEDYLYTLLNKIFTGSVEDNRNISFRINILKQNEPEAFILPNGSILISSGLLSTIRTEAELVSILAHEIAHYIFDHSIESYNKEVLNLKRAEFWENVVIGTAGLADTYLYIKKQQKNFGMVTSITSQLTSPFKQEILSRLAVSYNRQQEIQADEMSRKVLKALNYDTLALSVALKRIRDSQILRGNYGIMYKSSTHPNINERIGEIKDFDSYEKVFDSNYDKTISFVNSYNAWLELFYYSKYSEAIALVDRNIGNGVGTENDYIVKAVALRRTKNTIETNQQVLDLLSKAKVLNVTPRIDIFKEEAITYIRLGNKIEARKSLDFYLSGLKKIGEKVEVQEYIYEEIEWTMKMLQKVSI